MELEEAVVVVTGGASGIGRALALRAAEEGARGVVVADLDADGAAAVAAQIGARGLGVSCDVAEDAFGPIDLLCANAGVAIGTDLTTPLEDSELAFDVNVRAHVLAARHLVPRWLERGSGWFLSTASAAGLLTQIGSRRKADDYDRWLKGMRRLQSAITPA
jgi:NAD(P)-dependent dehydrogenase (short-subunit alcohol dehydrogenase family)